jgi:trehalose 6-phosphate synthase
MRRGAGGVVTALTALAERLGAEWVACARTPAEREAAIKARNRLVLPRSRASVHYAIPSEDAQRMHYSQISNPVLWYTQHYLWDLGREPRFTGELRRAWRQGYVSVNKKMAKTAAALVHRGDGVPWILSHDYQLYLFPAMFRELVGHAILQHFTHIPWPTPQYWKVLPRELRDGIVDGLLGADLLGFQAELDVRNFLMTCEENRGHRVDFRNSEVIASGRRVRVRAYPISIDVQGMERLAASAAVRQEEQRLAEWRPEKLIIRVDRTDPTKNVVRGFLAYERLLYLRPELRGRVQFWAFLQPSRQELAGYRSFLHSIRSTANRINRSLGKEGWEPIRLDFGESIRRAVAAYKNFDVLLVNSIFDGMNLVAKEGMLVNERNGVLVLSENTGAHAELESSAISINPFEIDATARALDRALQLPAAERKRRSDTAKRIVRRNDLNRWIDQQLHDLEEISGSRPTRLAG